MGLPEHLGHVVAEADEICKAGCCADICVAVPIFVAIFCGVLRYLL
jgi:hypothetical protein